MGLLSGRLTHDLDRRRTRVNATGRFAGLVELARLPAVVARCRGLLADDPTGAGVLFAEATRLQTLLPLPFELARTRLCAGGDPAQIAHPAAARPLLRAAMGAPSTTSWGARAEAELAATGLYRQPRPQTGCRTSTP